MAGGGRGACRPGPPHAPGGRRARCVRRGEADRDPALRVTSGMSAIRTHVRAQCEEQARLEHVFVWWRSGSAWGLGCADIWLIGTRAGGPGAVPRVAASACAVPSTESGTQRQAPAGLSSQPARSGRPGWSGCRSRHRKCQSWRRSREPSAWTRTNGRKFAERFGCHHRDFGTGPPPRRADGELGRCCTRSVHKSGECCCRFCSVAGGRHQCHRAEQWTGAGPAAAWVASS